MAVASEAAYLPESLTMGQLLAEAEAWRALKAGELVEGLVMGVGPEGIFIHFGGKSEGLVTPDEMQSLATSHLRVPEVGDSLVVYVLRPEREDGPAVLSLDRARSEEGWHSLEQALERGDTLQGTVVDRNRGGVVVDVEGVQGFVPTSHLAPDSWSSVEGSNSGLKEQPLRLKVLELDQQRSRAIFSERAAWQAWREEQKSRLLQELNEGDVRTGRITGISSFGAFVDLGGADGLIHLSELAWYPVTSPEEVVHVGDEVRVHILRIERESRRIALSLRQLQTEPWETIVETCQEGETVSGTVTNIVPFGAFVRIGGTVEGLVHISELSDRRITHPKEVVHEGDVLDLKILQIDTERKRIRLSLRQVVAES